MLCPLKIHLLSAFWTSVFLEAGNGHWLELWPNELISYLVLGLRSWTRVCLSYIPMFSASNKMRFHLTNFMIVLWTCSQEKCLLVAGKILWLFQRWRQCLSTPNATWLYMYDHPLLGERGGVKSWWRTNTYFPWSLNSTIEFKVRRSLPNRIKP